ncbi:MAG: response regulator transcription factor [Gemmatimonadales bacterium]
MAVIESSVVRGFVLTLRKVQVLEALSRGFHAKEVARLLGISINTTNQHVVELRRAFGARSNAQLVLLAYHYGFIGIDGACDATAQEGRSQPSFRG